MFFFSFPPVCLSDSHHIIEAQCIPQRYIKAHSWSINQLSVASVVVLKKFVNLHYNRGVAGVCDIDRFNNSSQVRFAHRPQAFDVFCDLHSQIHKYNLRTLLKNVDSNVWVDSDIPVVRQCQILRQLADFFFISVRMHPSQQLVLMACLTACFWVKNWALA